MNDYNEEARLRQQLLFLEQEVKRYLSREAILRYGNIKIVNPERANQIIILLSQLIQKGHITRQISDEQLKDLLLQAQEPKKQFNFLRK